MIVLLMPLVVVPLIVLGRRVRRLSRSSQDRIADTSGIADETLNAIQTVQAFTLEDVNARRFDAAVEDSFAAAVRRTKTRATLTALATMLVFGAHHVRALDRRARGGARRDDAAASSASSCSTPATSAIAAASLSEMWGEVQRAAGAMERLVELQNAVADDRRARSIRCRCPRPAAARSASSTSRSATRRDRKPKALDDFDLAIRPGETVAFVGPVGRRQEHDVPAAAALLRPGRRPHPRRRRRHRRAPTRSRCARASASCRRTRCCSRRARARTSATAGPGASDAEVEAAARGRGRGRIPAQAAARATTRSSASAARGCRAGSGSASRSRAPSCATRRSCCSTRRPARSTPRASGWCRTRSSG